MNESCRLLDEAAESPDREELVLLAILDYETPRTRGRCKACGADISHRAKQAVWCETCAKVSNKLAVRSASQRYKQKALPPAIRCVDCGRQFTLRKGPGRRCATCQKNHERTYTRNRIRKWRARSDKGGAVIPHDIIVDLLEKVVEQEAQHGLNTDEHHLEQGYGWKETLLREVVKVGVRIDDNEALRKQLIDVAGVCISWAEAMDASDGEAR